MEGTPLFLSLSSVLSPAPTRILLHVVFLTYSIAVPASSVSLCPDSPSLTLLGHYSSTSFLTHC